jgi:hypothetical protein
VEVVEMVVDKYRAPELEMDKENVEGLLIGTSVETVGVGAAL